eukprot:13929605-Alexandrium_andersonii.AAC.1
MDWVSTLAVGHGAAPEHRFERQGRRVEVADVAKMGARLQAVVGQKGKARHVTAQNAPPGSSGPFVKVEAAGVQHRPTVSLGDD